MTQGKTQHGAPTADAALEQIKELNEQFLKSARQAGELYLDSYEWAVDRTVELERRLARLSQQEWLKDVVDVQTEMARELSSAYTTAARSLLK